MLLLITKGEKTKAWSSDLGTDTVNLSPGRKMDRIVERETVS